jgi:hypothetical protein
VSTILKALKRLDDQRRADAQPRSLEQQVLAGGAAPPGGGGSAARNKWPFAAAGAAGVLLVAGASWFALREKSAPAVAAAAPAAAVPAQRPAPSFDPRSAQPSRGAPIAGTPLDAAVRSGMRVPSAREDPVASGRLARAEEPEGEIAAGATEPAAVGTAIAELPPSAAPPLVAQTPSGLEIPRQPAQRAMAPPEPAAARPAPADAPAAPAPVRSEAEARASDQTPRQQAEAAADESTAEPRAAAAAPAPEVWVERTQWHPTPAKRSALVRVGEDAPLEVREGDEVGGVVVKEIRPSGVLFLHAGAEFKRAVGER